MAVSSITKIAQQRKLLAAMKKALDEVPQSWRGVPWMEFNQKFKSEQTKLAEMLAKQKGKGKAIIGGAAGAATAAAVSEDDAEAVNIAKISPALRKAAKELKYHGTGNMFLGPFDDKKRDLFSTLGGGHYFSDDIEAANAVSTLNSWRKGDKPGVIQAYLDAEAPLDAESLDPEYLKALSDQAGELFNSYEIAEKIGKPEIGFEGRPVNRSSIAKFRDLVHSDKPMVGAGEKVASDDIDARSKLLIPRMDKALEIAGRDAITNRLNWPFLDQRMHREWMVPKSSQIKRLGAIGGAAATAAAVQGSGEEAEAAVNPKGMWNILGRELKNFSDEQLIKFLNRADEDVTRAIQERAARGLDRNAAYEPEDIAVLKTQIASSEAHRRGLDLQKIAKDAEAAEAPQDFSHMKANPTRDYLRVHEGGKGDFGGRLAAMSDEEVSQAYIDQSDFLFDLLRNQDALSKEYGADKWDSWRQLTNSYRNAAYAEAKKRGTTNDLIERQNALVKSNRAATNRAASEREAETRRLGFKLIPGDKPPDPKLIAGITAGGVGAGMAASAEAQQPGQEGAMPQSGRLFDQMAGRPFQSRYGNQPQAQPAGPMASRPSQEGLEVNPATGRLWDQMVGRPFVSRYSSGQLRDALEPGGGGGFPPDIEAGMNDVRGSAINRMLRMYGEDPIIRRRLMELTTSGSQGADFSDVDAGQSSTAPDQIYPTAIPQTFEEMRGEFPPPSPGMIPQEQVEGYTNPNRSKSMTLLGAGEFGHNVAGYAGAAVRNPRSGILAPTQRFLGDTLDFLVTGPAERNRRAVMMGSAPEQEEGIETPTNFLQRWADENTDELVADSPQHEDIIRRMVEAESVVADYPLGGAIKALKVGGTAAAAAALGLGLAGNRTAGKAARAAGKMAMGQVPRYKRATGLLNQPPLATATRLPSPNTQLRKAADTAGRALAGIRNFWAPLGARFDAARLYKEKGAKRALTKGLAGGQESYDNIANSIQMGFAQQGRALYEAMMRTTKGDPAALKALGQQLRIASKSPNAGIAASRLRGLDPEVLKAFNGANNFYLKQVDDLEKMNAITPQEAAEFRKMGAGLKLTFFDAIRDPQHLNKIRNSNPWNQLHSLIQRHNPAMSADEIVGEMEGLLGDKVVESFEKTGKLSTAYLRQNPGLQSVVGYKSTDPLIKKLMGEVDDFPSTMVLAGEVIAKKIAQHHVGQNVIQSLYDAGIATTVKGSGLSAVEPRLVPRGMLPGGTRLYLPTEIKDSLKFGAEGVEALTKLNRAAAAWRVGKTVLSPTSAGVQNYISGITASIFSGRALDPAFWSVDLPDAFRASMEITRRGVTRGAQGFERGMARQGMGSGALSGLTSQYMRRAGMHPGYTGTDRLYEKIPRRLHGFTAGMARFFEQGDVIYKRAIAPRMVAENVVATRNLHPDDVALLDSTFGTSNPVDMAGKQIGDEFQSYQRTSHKLKEFSKRHPVFGPFVSFTVEQARNAGNHVAYLGKELKVAKYAQTPELKKLMLKRAMQHATGLVAGASIPFAVREAWETVRGSSFTDGQREAFEKRGVPEYDRGNIAMLDRDGDEITYSPLGRLNYFNDVLKFGKHGLQAVAAGMRGEWDAVDDRMLDMMVDAVSSLTPYQEPIGSAYELATNRRLEGSAAESILAGHRGNEGALMSNATNVPVQVGDWFTKSASRTLAPTFVNQARDLAAGEGVRSVFPAGQIKKSNLGVAIRRDARTIGDEKQNLYNARLSVLRNDRTMSLEVKRREVDQMRKDWNETLGPRMLDAAREWDRMFPRDRVLREFSGLGQNTVGIMLNEGRIPLFEEVFAESIPDEIRRR